MGKFTEDILSKKRYEASLRRRKRTIKHRQHQKDRGLKCPDCSGYMSWCSCCDMWSKYCCVDYGTCQCS
jgi:hypothetical protein